MKATIKIGVTCINIFLDDMLHLSLKRNLIYGIQSWKNSTNNYEIEYHFIGQPSIRSQYDNKNTFISLLKELEKLDIIT